MTSTGEDMTQYVQVYMRVTSVVITGDMTRYDRSWHAWAVWLWWQQLWQERVWPDMTCLTMTGDMIHEGDMSRYDKSEFFLSETSREWPSMKSVSSVVIMLGGDMTSRCMTENDMRELYDRREHMTRAWPRMTCARSVDRRFPMFHSVHVPLSIWN